MHLDRMQTILLDALAASELKLGREIGPKMLVAGLVGGGCEPARREFGGLVQLAPLMVLSSGLWAWVGYREEWAIAEPAGSTKRFSFRTSSLTIHFGYKNHVDKPQMFRAEWAGIAEWSNDGFRYAAGQAGHPHWQFDALSSVRRDEVADRAATALAILKAEEAEADAAHDFCPHGVTLQDVLDQVSSQELSRIHFSSAARWWRDAPDDAHAHAPGSEHDIQAWLAKTVGYLRIELGRLQAA